MFESVASFWTGVGTTLGGLLALHAAWKIVAGWSRKITYDVISWAATVKSLPKNIECEFIINGNRYREAFETTYLLKNQSGEVLTDDSFRMLPLVSVEGQNTIISHEVLWPTPTTSLHISLEQDTVQDSPVSQLILHDLMIPNGQAVAFSILSTKIISSEMHAVHQRLTLKQLAARAPESEAKAAVLICFLMVIISLPTARKLLEEFLDRAQGNKGFPTDGYYLYTTTIVLLVFLVFLAFRMFRVLFPVSRIEVLFDEKRSRLDDPQ